MNNQATKQEVERKFLLRRVPSFPEKTVSDRKLIYQGYTEDGTRYRMEQWLDGVAYTRTTKVRVDDSECIETETEVTSREFNYSRPVKALRKYRYSWIDGPLLMCVDHIQSGPILFEAEYIGGNEEEAQLFKKADIELPDFIKEELYAEVTGDPRFLNCNLCRPVTIFYPTTE
jgi:hypothetical protein